MFQIDLVYFFAIIISGVMLFFALLVVLYQRRESVLRDRRRLITVFCCIKCKTIYTRKHAREYAVCPHCGFKNSHLKF